MLHDRTYAYMYIAHFTGRMLLTMLSHLNDQLIALVTQFYHSTSLIGIAIAMAIESCCIPLPSEVIMPVSGILIANGTLLKGEPVWLSIFLVSLAGAIGCLLGS